MKKVFLPLLLAVILAVAAVPYRGPLPEYAVGKTVGEASYGERISSFADFINETPILAEVLITQYCGSLSESTGFDSTLYRARVVTCYKNTTEKELSTIELVQDGTTEWTLNGYPLFQTGDRLLLALAPCSDYEGPISDYLGGYYLVNGGAQTAMQIIRSEDGDVCRTFLPSMTDLPTTNVTVLMQNSVTRNIENKNRSLLTTTLPELPPYSTATYTALKEYIERVLA